MGRYEGVDTAWYSHGGGIHRPALPESSFGEYDHFPGVSRQSGRCTPTELEGTHSSVIQDRSSVFANYSRAASGDESSPVSVQLENTHGPVPAFDVQGRFLNGVLSTHTGDPTCFASWVVTKPEGDTDNLMNEAWQLPSPALSLVSWSAEAANDREADDLVRLTLSTALLSWVTENEQNMLAEGKLQDFSPFHASRIPSISVEAYFERIYTFAFCSKACYVIALLYLDRLSRRNGCLRMTSFTAHRLLITAVMLAAKFFDDIFYNNAYYAKVGGLPLREMNGLEVRMLQELAYQLNVSVEEFHTFESKLVYRAVRAAPELSNRLSGSGFPLQRSLWRPLCHASPLSASPTLIQRRVSEGSPETEGTFAGFSNLARPLSRTSSLWENAVSGAPWKRSSQRDL